MKELSEHFIGRGEVRGFEFKQIEKADNGYIYSVTGEGVTHYEVFKRRENTQFDCVSYPRSSSFGVWAWSINTLEKAKERLELFNEVKDGKIHTDV